MVINFDGHIFTINNQTITLGANGALLYFDDRQVDEEQNASESENAWEALRGVCSGK
ncbi:hypothetical protein [Vibrio sp. D173a]|uniref:hypothetical protein n=1 Tax=Vibrio sp. D173a TaxID=2836349 RepID=UPI002557741A|nr:hypothetical protein [Vibrio sp. D173a]